MSFDDQLKHDRIIHKIMNKLENPKENGPSKLDWIRRDSVTFDEDRRGMTDKGSGGEILTICFGRSSVRGTIWDEGFTGGCEGRGGL